MKNTEDQFRQAQKMEAVGLLAGGVAHDFNNILASVLMGLGLLHGEALMDPNVRTLLKDLEKDVLRGTALIRQLLTFSRQQAIEPKLLDVKDVLAGLLKMLRRLLGEHIELTMRAPEGSPPIYADEGMLEQVVINLCVNSRDAMPHGGRLTLCLETIDISAEAAVANPEARTGCFVQLSVIDTGCGMDDHRDRYIAP